MTDIRLADFVADFVATHLRVETVFTVTGGGAMYLNDAFGKHNNISYIPMHHEQSAAMAAEGYYRESGGVAVCQVTTGPGGTNAITGCAGAWVDSEPILFISGQVELISIADSSNRQTGVQEIDIISMVKGITKSCLVLNDPNMILYELQRLSYIALSGRKGPVWIDIPLDLQNYRISNTDKLTQFKPLKEDIRDKKLRTSKYKKALGLLKNSKRPIILVGNGCRSSLFGLTKFLNKNQVPVITGWNGRDLVDYDNNLLMGSAGLFGNRQANLAIQKSDLILGLGYRFSIPQTGYDPSSYAPNASIISVEVDSAEITKMGGFVDIPINANVEEFFEHMNSVQDEVFTSLDQGWISWCKYLNDKKFDPRPENKKIINSFDINKIIENYLKKGDTVVTDMGTSFTCTHQDLQLKSGVKLFTSSGVAAMGFGLPGAIGCSHAKKQSDGVTFLITGDGGLMFNLQELQSAVTYNLNIKIMVYENGGYLTMKHMQQARFNKLVGSEVSSKLECPDFNKIATAFGIPAQEARNPNEALSAIDWLFEEKKGPKLLVLHIDPWQPLIPRVQTRSDENGNLLPPSIDQMFPFLTLNEEAEISENYRKLVS